MITISKIFKLMILYQFSAALCDRLLDYEESVRKRVVSVVGDVVCHAVTSIPVETIKLVSERLRDKSVCILISSFLSLILAISLLFSNDFCHFQLVVKRYTMERLADIYKASCMNQSRGTTENHEYDWIVGKILRCFYDKDFR